MEGVLIFEYTYLYLKAKVLMRISVNFNGYTYPPICIILCLMLAWKYPSCDFLYAIENVLENIQWRSKSR